MTSEEVAALHRRIEELAGEVHELSVCVAGLTAKRNEWERQQGLGARMQAALIAAIGGIGAAIGGALITIWLGAG